MAYVFNYFAIDHDDKDDVLYVIRTLTVDCVFQKLVNIDLGCPMCKQVSLKFKSYTPTKIHVVIQL